MDDWSTADLGSCSAEACQHRGVVRCSSCQQRFCLLHSAVAADSSFEPRRGLFGEGRCTQCTAEPARSARRPPGDLWFGLACATALVGLALLGIQLISLGQRAGLVPASALGGVLLLLGVGGAGIYLMRRLAFRPAPPQQTAVAQSDRSPPNSPGTSPGPLRSAAGNPAPEPAGVPVATSTPVAAASVDPRLVVVAGPDKGRTFPLVGPEATIGRSIASDVRLNDDNLAYQHARLHHDGERWLVEDIIGWRDTYVDEEPLIAPRELHGGEVIRLGLNALRFEPSDDDRAPQLR